MENKSGSVTVDNISYDVAQFSPEVQQAVSIYNAFQADLQKAQLEVIKVQAAIQNVGQQLTAAIKTELEKKAAASKQPATQAE